MYKCCLTNECAFEFASRDELLTHMAEVHPGVSNIARRKNGVYPFEGQMCKISPDCRFIGATDDDMITHIRKVHRTNEFKKEGFKWIGQ